LGKGGGGRAPVAPRPLLFAGLVWERVAGRNAPVKNSKKSSKN
jgi:hypothetical protein